MFVMGTVTSCLLLDTVFSHGVFFAGTISIITYTVRKFIGSTRTLTEEMAITWHLLSAVGHLIMSRGYHYGHLEMHPGRVTERMAMGVAVRWAETPLRVRDVFVDPTQAAKHTWEAYARFDPRYAESDSLIVGLAALGYLVMAPLFIYVAHLTIIR